MTTLPFRLRPTYPRPTYTSMKTLMGIRYFYLKQNRDLWFSLPSDDLELFDRRIEIPFKLNALCSKLQ